MQISLAPGPSARRRTYRFLADTARDLIASGMVKSFFFMHKPPGLRARFEGRKRQPELLQAELTDRLRHLDGQAAAPVCGMYELETYLFGGLRSMRLVRELFTVDSLAWLDHHTDGGPEALADWRLSLVLLGELLGGLGVVGWEHRGVWEVVRDDTGRRLGTGLDGDARRAATGILDAWHAGPRALLDPLPDKRRTAVEAHAAAVRRGAERWRTGYFESGDVIVGPRRAAAYYVIFHWNRGRLSLARQSLLTHALAGDGRF